MVIDYNKILLSGFLSFAIRKFSALVFIVLLVSCGENSQQHTKNIVEQDLPAFLKYMESGEDSMEMMASLNAQGKFKNIVLADVETQPVESLNNEDAADDPAIWVNEQYPEKSLILGTNKTGGIYVYDLKGNVLQYRKIGRINNIDLRDGYIYNNKEVVLVAGSNRSNNCISIFYINKESGQLSDTIANIKSLVNDVYGICLYKSRVDDRFYIFVNGKDGLVEQWQIISSNETRAKFIKRFRVSSQPEGMIASDKSGILFLGIEDAGIYKINAEPQDAVNPVLLAGSDTSNSNIAFDIEGLALFSHERTDFLIASSQGNSSYALFELGKKEGYHSSFIIGNGIITDGVEETDGIEVTTAFLGNSFPKGILVVQDGFNFERDSLLNQNFKIVSFDKILGLLNE